MILLLVLGAVAVFAAGAALGVWLEGKLTAEATALAFQASDGWAEAIKLAEEQKALVDALTGGAS